MHPRNQALLEPVTLPSGLLIDLLNALGDGLAVLRAVLRLCITAVNADRGLAFDSAGAAVLLGFADSDAQLLRTELSALSGDGICCYDREEPASGARRPGRAVRMAAGMAGAIQADQRLFIVAVERSARAFGAKDRRRLGAVLRLARPTLEQTAQLERLRRFEKSASCDICPAELPLTRLNKLPQLEELEKMLIQEALKRFKNNKTRAAEVLGMTREGLRKKIERLGVA